MTAKIIARTGLLIVISMMFSYLEALIPLPFAFPGVKLGLANLVTVFALYRLSWKQAGIVALLRVLLTALLFGNAYSLLFSFVGAALSLTVMVPLQKSGWFSITGVSVAGGVAHNAGQLLVAILVLKTSKLTYYLPVLGIAGAVAGVCIGLLGGLVTAYVNPDAKL